MFNHWRRYGALLVIDGAMSVGLLSSFMLYVLYVASSAGGLGAVLSSVISGVVHCKRLNASCDKHASLF